MKARAKRVHEGADGSIHFLSSGDTYSLLIITDPVLGEDRIEFDGPCLQEPRHPNLSIDYDGVVYRSISLSGSTRVTVHPGKPSLVHSISGVCESCMFGDHDYELWPVCPLERQGKKAEDMASADVLSVFTPLPEPEPVRVPVPVADASPEPPAKRDKPRVRFLSDTEPARAQPTGPTYLMDGFTANAVPEWEEPLSEERPTPPDLRWGPGPGANW